MVLLALVSTEEKWTFHFVFVWKRIPRNLRELNSGMILLFKKTGVGVKFDRLKVMDFNLSQLMESLRSVAQFITVLVSD